MKTVVHLLLFTTICFASACSTPVKRVDRDTSNMHFGKWRMTVAGTHKKLLTSSGGLTCWNMSIVSNLQIIDGTVNASLFGSFLQGYINTEGQFSLSTSSGTTFNLKGKLNAENGTGDGRLTQVLNNEGGQGCSSKVEFLKDQ